jgi:hypothetical protein
VLEPLGQMPSLPKKSYLVLWPQADLLVLDGRLLQENKDCMDSDLQ